MNSKRLIIGITGASGAPLALALLHQLMEIPQVETHVILSHCGEMTLTQETGLTVVACAPGALTTRMMAPARQVEASRPWAW